MRSFAEEYLKKSFITDTFLITTNFTYDQLYAISNYRKDA